MTVNSIVRRSVDEFRAAAIGLLAAEDCVWCGSSAALADVCSACLADLPWNDAACPGCALPMPVAAPCPACARAPRPFDAAWTAFRMEVPVEGAIHALKYGARFDQARRLGRLAARALSGRPLPDLLIPVPLHPGRLRKRGYNQAHELARAVARYHRVRIGDRCARRVRATPDQIGMSAAERRRNLRGAFEIGTSLNGLHVALLDDVLTTGATLGALAEAAKAAGAARVEAWAIARVARRVP